MKRLTRPKYLVALGDGAETLEVDIAPGDQFRAELEAGKWGLPKIGDAPQLHTALWCYCALLRLKLYAGDWPTFKNTDLYAWEPVRDEDGEQVETPVDPTQGATSGSDSSSATTSPESPTPPAADGSTPTSTSGS